MAKGVNAQLRYGESSGELRKLFCGFRDGTVPFDTVAAQSMPTLRRLARAAASVYGIRNDCSEDICQELVLELPGLAAKYDDKYPIEALLSLVARRIAYAEKNRAFRSREVALFFRAAPGALEDSEPGVGEADHAITMLVAKNDNQRIFGDHSPDIDRQRAIEELNRKLYDSGRLPSDSRGNNGDSAMTAKMTKPTKLSGITFDVVTMPGADLNPIPAMLTPLDYPTPVVAPRKREPTSEQQELKDIRLTLGMTQPQFAAQLSAETERTIAVPRLSAYEYGRTQKVPEWVMEAARDLLKREARGVHATRSKYDNRSMRQILDGWANQLRVRPEDTRTLAKRMGTTETTIRRWRNNEARPGVQALLLYETLITDYDRRRKRADEAASEMVPVTVADLKKREANKVRTSRTKKAAAKPVRKTAVRATAKPRVAAAKKAKPMSAKGGAA